MKILILAPALFAIFATPAFAQKTKVTACATDVVTLPGRVPVATRVAIYQQGAELRASVGQVIPNQAIVQLDMSAFYFEGTVRSGLTGKEDDKNQLNEVEILINHAIDFTTSSKTKSFSDAGFDLRKVRSAGVYAVGSVEAGAGAIVEAKDEAGRALGSFLIGRIITPCR